jgi:hypothetical protein
MSKKPVLENVSYCAKSRETARIVEADKGKSQAEAMALAKQCVKPSGAKPGVTSEQLHAAYVGKYLGKV